ncbi:hypothetical protein, partial [Cellulomonas chitinilytica]|uniref:hypothetical protein n=1 Tax=Cellulomonas chitinilytica TaxID=398759 RepID=UPI00194408D0
RSVFAASTRSHDGRRGRWLVGRDLDTGAERWSAPLPDGVDVLTVIDHTLLGMAYSTGERTELG